MNAGTRFMAGAVGLTVLLGAVGCQDGRDEQIKALQAQVRDLGDRNADLEGKLRACNDDSNNAKQRALQLQNMLDDCKRQLAGVPQPAPTDGWTRSGPYAWIDVGEEILFDSGKADIKASGKQALQKIVGDLRSKFPGKIYMVIGHTDTDPIKHTAKKWDDNLDLSLGRARAVAIELMAQGIDPKSLIAGGQGEYNPKDPANKKLNRRVTVIAADPPPGRPSITGLDEPIWDSTGELVAVTMR